MEKDILSAIEEKKRDFSKGQTRIARYIEENFDKAAFMTAAKLGKTAGVSESTVVRFASELGFEGYPEMRLALQNMIRNRLTSVQRIEVAKTVMGDKDTFSAVLQSDVEKIMLTMESTDRAMFDRAVRRIVDAEHVYILGTRTSAPLAMFMGFYFNLLMPNVKTVYENSASELLEQIIRISRNDVLVGPLSLINALIVSVGGQTHENISNTFSELERVWDEYEVYEKNDEF